MPIGLKIPFVNLSRQYATLRDEILSVTDTVLQSGQVLGGPMTVKFESEIAKRCDREYAVAVNSGTQALIFAQLTLGNLERVLIPSVSFAATINSVVLAKNTPVICEVDENALLDITRIDRQLGDQGIGAVMYANLFGHVIDYDRLEVACNFFNRGNRIPIIEDAAQSFGARYCDRPSGSLGDISILSFDPTKNLPNYGSGGMVLTDSFSHYSTLVDLCDNGKLHRHQTPGTNSKMSEVDCAQMLVKLQYFDQWQSRRAQIAGYYTDKLMPYCDIILPADNVKSSWHKYVIQYRNRPKLAAHLADRGIETKIHYPTMLTELEVAQQYAISESFQHYFTGANHCQRSLSLPIYPELTDSEVEAVAQAVIDFYVV